MGFVNSKRYDGVQLYHKQNKDISYYIRYKDENNKLQRIKIGDKSKGITEHYCNQKRNEIINSIRLGTDVPIKKKKTPELSFDSVAQKYIEDLQLHSKEGTITEVKNNYGNHLQPLFGEQAVDTIKSSDLEELQKEKIKKLSPKTVNVIIDLFGTIFNYGLNKELYNLINPATKVKRFKLDNTRERFLSEEEIEQLYQAVGDSELITLFVKLALTTGARLESLLHIQKKDVDIASQTITLHDLKNKDSYKGFLTDDVLELIKPRFHTLKANDFVISLEDRQKMTSRQIQSRLKPILDKMFNAELETSDRKNRVVIHSLRHTFASHLAIKGTPIFTIQKLMNHKDIKQTMRYAKLAPDSGRDFVNGLYR